MMDDLFSDLKKDSTIVVGVANSRLSFLQSIDYDVDEDKEEDTNKEKLKSKNKNRVSSKKHQAPHNVKKHPDDINSVMDEDSLIQLFEKGIVIKNNLNDIKNSPNDSKNDSDNEFDIEDIVALIHDPIKPLKDSKGYVYDTLTIAARCERFHIHKYYLSDIIRQKELSKCITCNSGNKFMNLVRETAENIFGVPFILAEKKIDTDANAEEFTNPIVRINISCYRHPRLDDSEEVFENGVLLIKIFPTQSPRKIKKYIYNQVIDHIDDIPLSKKTKSLIINMYKAKQKKIHKRMAPLASAFHGIPDPFQSESIAGLCIENNRGIPSIYS